MNTLSDYLRHQWPHLPGGPFTLLGLVLILVSLLMLYKRTGWGGWMAWFISIVTYSIPLLVEFHS